MDSKASTPDWLTELLGIPQAPGAEQRIEVRGQSLIMHDGILRLESLISAAQKQTQGAFGFKWQKRDTFEAERSLSRMREWLNERYGSIEQHDWLSGLGGKPIVLDAGCGAAMSGIEYFGPVLDRIRYLGVDVSEAVDVARDRFHERNIQAAFLQADITKLPLVPGSVDMIFSEGVLHHTDSTRGALSSLAPLLRTGGRFLFYVYRRKGPVREFTDDYIREKLQAMSPQQGWDAMIPLTKLGKALGDLDLEIQVPETVDLLNIPAGKINIQRLFYWHVFKAFYRNDYTIDEMNHINFDWYFPKNAYRQTEEEVRLWCNDLGLVIEHEAVEEAGITVVARKI